MLFDKFMEIKKKEEDANHRIYLSGTPLLYGWIYHYLPNMALILVITSIIILVMLYVYMNQGGLWWWPFIGAILCSIWGLGFSAFLGFHFDPLIIVIPFLLSARAMSHGVQWVERFTEEYRRTGRHQGGGAHHRGRALSSGPHRHYGRYLGAPHHRHHPHPDARNLAFLGTFWAGACIFTVLVLFPPLFACFKNVKVPKKSDVPGRRSYKIEYFTEHLLRTDPHQDVELDLRQGQIHHGGYRRGRPHPGGHLLRHLKFGDANPGDPILWPDSEYNTDIQRINDRFPGVDQMWIAIEGKRTNAVISPDVMNGMEALKYHMMQDPNVGYAVSIADLIKGIKCSLDGNDPKMELMPTDTAGDSEPPVSLSAWDVAPGDMDPWITCDFDATNVRLYLKNHEGKLLEGGHHQGQRLYQGQSQAHGERRWQSRQEDWEVSWLRPTR